MLGKLNPFLWFNTLRVYPERATLSIAKGSDGNWHIRQLKIKANQEPTFETISVVDTWLRRFSLSV